MYRAAHVCAASSASRSTRSATPRLPRPAAGYAPEGTSVCRIRRVAVAARRARPRTARATATPVPTPCDASDGTDRRPTRDWPGSAGISCSAGWRCDRAHPARGVNHRSPPPPPIFSVAPLGRPGRCVGLPVTPRSRELVCAAGGPSPRALWPSLAAVFRLRALGCLRLLKPARFPYAPRGTAAPAVPLVQRSSVRFAYAACQID
jgi:hypothetical protein